MFQSDVHNCGFSLWLSDKLNILKVDEQIFLNYILSILEGEETKDEKMDILKSLFIANGASVSEEDISKHCSEILDRWHSKLLDISVNKNTEKPSENVEQKLARLLESNVRLEETTQTCKLTDEELKIRQVILSKYSHADDPDEEYEEDEKNKMGYLQKNTNSLSIHLAEKEKREKAKLENQKKKEKDKLEREKQKLTHQEKKDARKKRAQKVEHHRK